MGLCGSMGTSLRSNLNMKSSSLSRACPDDVLAQTPAAKGLDLADETVFEHLEERLLAAVRDGDADTLETLLADDLIYIDQYGHQLDKNEDMAVHRSGNLQIERLDVRSRNIRLLGDGAVVTTRIKIVGSFIGSPFSGFFSYTRVWERSEDRWLVVSAHSSSSAMEMHS
jgi:ketosteroid isomerase-like protein